MPMLIRLVPQELVAAPGGVDLRVRAQRDRAGAHDQVVDADLRPVDASVALTSARKASSASASTTAGEVEVRGGWLSVSRCAVTLRMVFSGTPLVVSGRPRHGAAAGRVTGSPTGAVPVLGPWARARDGGLDVGADDAAAGPGAGDRGEIDAVFAGDLAGQRRGAHGIRGGGAAGPGAGAGSHGTGRRSPGGGLDGLTDWRQVGRPARPAFADHGDRLRRSGTVVPGWTRICSSTPLVVRLEVHRGLVGLDLGEHVALAGRRRRRS